MNGQADASVVHISCGSSHSVALLNCDILVSWGRGEDGQLGHGDAHERLDPSVVFSLAHSSTDFVSCGAEYTLAVSQTKKEVFSWGWGDFGRLGHGDCDDVFLPQPIKFFSGIKINQVACGDTHTMAISESGELFGFGRNQNGQLGLGTTVDALVPTKVLALQDCKVSVVACGAEHTICCTSEGKVFGWGWGQFGNIGDGHTEDRHTPVPVVGLDGVMVTKVACGWRHSLVISDEGRVYSFGWSKYGQLGHGDFLDRCTAALMELLQDKTVVLVAGGWRHTMAVDDKGIVYSWGWNKFGQLGLGDNVDRNSPNEIKALSGHVVSQLACGWRHTLAVTEEGQLFSWGRGMNGQLGHGECKDLWTPRLLASLSRGHLDIKGLLGAHISNSSIAATERFAVVPDGKEGGATNGVPTPVSAVNSCASVPQVPDTDAYEPPAKKAKQADVPAA